LLRRSCSYWRLCRCGRSTAEAMLPLAAMVGLLRTGLPDIRIRAALGL
jgi:hypothetical protein